MFLYRLYGITFTGVLSRLKVPLFQARRMSNLKRSDEEWKVILTPDQFRVLRKAETEKPFTGKYYNHNENGIYQCAGCNTPLYRSGTKFDSKCGWPAFYECLPGAINRRQDTSSGGIRTEITCAKCDCHLGHVFKGEKFPTPTDERHCVNSISIKFEKE